MEERKLVEGAIWMRDRPTGKEEKKENIEVYSRDECVFNYCSHPETCKDKDECQNPK